MKMTNFKPIWTEEDEKYFFERYDKASFDDRPRMLVSQAYKLFVLNTRKEPRLFQAIHRLLDNYFLDYPDDSIGRSIVLHLLGRIEAAKDNLENALNHYQQALEVESEMPEPITGVWRDFAAIVVSTRNTDLYDQAEKALSSRYDKLGDKMEEYDSGALLSLISSYRGNQDKAKYYRERAEQVLQDIITYDKHYNYVSMFRIPDFTMAKKDAIRDMILAQGFEIDLDNDGCWVRKGRLCLNCLTLVCLYDAVVLEAHITFKDAVSRQDRQMGLTGWVACLGKRPFRKDVRKLEELLKSFAK